VSYIAVHPICHGACWVIEEIYMEDYVGEGDDLRGLDHP
jgi:hypothetical protein